MSIVNVVIPCYNYGEFLPSCVASVLDDQPDSDVRVLIIDDASTDSSAEIAQKLAASDPRVDVVVHNANKGHIATYNEGLLDWAEGGYSVLLDADDLLTPGSLSRAVELLDAHPEVGFAYGHPVHFSHGAPLPLPRITSSGWTIWPGLWWLRRRFKEANGCITTPEVVVRTSLQQKVGGYDPRLPHTGDMEMWMRLAVHADVGYVRGADQAFYRIHPQNMSKDRNQLVNLKQRRLAYETLLDTSRDLIPCADQLSDDVHRKLAGEALQIAARAYDRRRLDRTPIAELTEFATDCWPQAEQLAAFRALHIRRLIGPRIMPYLQPLVLPAAIRRAREWLWWESWKRRGI